MSKVWFPWQPPRSPVNIRPGAGKPSPLGVAAQHVVTLGTLLLGLVLAMGFQGCASAAEPLTPHRPTAISPLTIRGFNGPEDMQSTPDGKHIVVSELPVDWAHPQGPSLVVVDLLDDRVHPLSVKMQPEAGWGDAACPVPTALSTHGLFVSQRPDGHVQIIVVNHTGRESIEFIELVNGASGFSAIWRGCVAFEGGLLNDLVAYGSNGLIATVMLDKTLVGDKDPMAFLFSGAKTGYLAEWNPHAVVAQTAMASDCALSFVITIAARTLNHGALPSAFTRRPTGMAEVPQ